MRAKPRSDSGTGLAGVEADPSGAVDAGTPPGEAAVAIEVRNLSKTFPMPGHRPDSVKERALHPFSRGEIGELHALRDVSFDIYRGEFFGVVGRNGSGKSTLLKILASIYAADSGRIRMAGSLAPFIELGVGFNPELTAEENIVLNGVMMGLSPVEARAKTDSVLDFAGLREFVDMKLKNYSSGMQVRLAFSVMLEAETDILLIDEVLAVGDAAFQQKCADVFTEMRDSDRTVILVTHDMRSVDSYCDRAMLLNGGRLEALGDPHEVGRRYLSLNFDQAADEFGVERTRTREETAATAEVALAAIWLEDDDGARVRNVEQGDTIRFHAVIEARREITAPMVGFSFADANGILVFAVSVDSDYSTPRIAQLKAGERAHITGRVPNRLATGRYDLGCWVGRGGNVRDVAMHVPYALNFVVYGQEDVPGLVLLEHEIDVEVRDPAEK